MLLGVLISLLVVFFSNAISSSHVIGSDFKMCRDIDAAATAVEGCHFDGQIDNSTPGISASDRMMKYSNSFIYEGDILNCKRHGEGHLIAANGEIYEGSWRSDKKHGKGRLQYINGSLYEGDFAGDVIQGRGQMTLSHGALYDGDWVNGLWHGTGRFRGVQGSVSEGDFVNGKMHGRGREQDADGNVYEGEWVANQKHGNGLLTYAIGDVYEGDWVHGEKHGKGRMKYANGDVYEGDWENDQIHGKGRMKYANGNIYEGDWENDQKHGYGRYVDTDGGNYEGEFKWHKFDGKGRLQYADGNIYIGDLKDGVIHGKGVLQFTDGSIYIGDLKDGVIRGKGTHTSAYGFAMEGDFVNGKLHGAGRVRLPWALFWSYSFEFADGRPRHVMHHFIHGVMSVVPYGIVCVVLVTYTSGRYDCYAIYYALLISKLFIIPVHRILGKQYVTNTLAFYAASWKHTSVLKWLLDDIGTETEALDSVLIRIFVCYSNPKPTQDVLDALEALMSCNEHVEEYVTSQQFLEYFSFETEAAKEVIDRLQVWRRRKHFFLFLHGCRFWLFDPSGHQTTKSWGQVLIGYLFQQQKRRKSDEVKQSMVERPPHHPIFYQEDVCKVIASFL